MNSLDTHPDILVVGGGIAGIAAASAASAHHCKVLLIERNTYLGGKATSAYVGTICGAYRNGEALSPSLLQNGFTADFLHQLALLSNQKPIYHESGLWFLPYDRSAFIQLAESILIKNKVHIQYETTLSGLSIEHQHIQQVEISSQGKTIELQPKIIIDASGTAISSTLSSQEHISSDVYQAPAQVFEWTQLNQSEEFTCSMLISRWIKQGIQSHALPSDFNRISIIPGTLHEGRAYFKLGIPFHVPDHPDQQKQEQANIYEALQQITQYLKSNCLPFAHLTLGYIASEIGVRTGPRNKGNYLLTKKDVLSGNKHQNSIARGAWPVEFWHTNKSPEFQFLDQDDWYEIPAESLESAQFSNLYSCGRNISAEEMAIASVRVMGICLQTGYAAGILAAGQCLGRSRHQSIEEIQNLFPKIPA